MLLLATLSILEMDIDAFNTSLMGRFDSAIMLEDNTYKQTYLTDLSRWVDNGFRTRSLNNCSLSYRYGGWLITVAGHSRYLWAPETYKRENHYGRHLTHWSMQLLHGNGSFESGYQLNGWDWCHIPDTTAAEIPMEMMKANVLNVDEFSGYEEMLLSDEWFAGGLSFGYNAAMYSMKLHEHDKYNGSIRARKSFFAFENRIICIGDGLENSLENSELHTTLFQNSIAPQEDTETEILDCQNTIIKDKFGNAYFIPSGKLCLTKGLQKSYHEETDAVTEGYFEKAYINHGDICTGSDSDRYEYMLVIAPTKTELAIYSNEMPYSIYRADSTAHIVRDNLTGITACSAFNQTSVDENILSVTPSILMYTIENDQLDMCVSSPDLALYRGPSDQIFDSKGKRKERSVYGRRWINNPAHNVEIIVTVKGCWAIDGNSNSDVEIKVENGNTILTFTTAESRSEQIKLTRK